MLNVRSRPLIISIVGTRPHLTKLASIAKAFSTAAVDHQVLHTGQHYDAELFADFIEPLGLPKFNKLYSAGNKPSEEQFAYIISHLSKDLKSLKPDLVLVYGDTTSTAAGAIAASLCKVPIAHVEAGLREFTFDVPEECNKRTTDSLSSLFFCPSKVAVAQLLHEGIHSSCIRFTGDTALDLLKWPTPDKTAQWVIDQGLKSRDYALCTFHREINTDNLARLKGIVSALSQIEKEIILPLHPRSQKAIQKANIKLPRNIIPLPPIGFFELQEAIKLASFVLTDSGGITKEAFQHKKPVILIDDQTEWIEAVQEGWVKVVGADQKSIVNAAKSIKKPKKHSKPYGDGNAGQKVVDECLAFVREIRKSNTGPSSPYRRR